MVLALAQHREHIFQRHRSELVETNAADQGIHHLQHPPVCSDGAGGVFGLPLQPAGREFLKGHFAILGVASLEAALQLLGGVGDILPDAALGDTGRDLDGLCLADFFAVGPVAVADGDLISPLASCLMLAIFRTLPWFAAVFLAQPVHPIFLSQP